MSRKLAEGLVLRGHRVTVVVANFASPIGFYRVETSHPGHPSSEEIGGVAVRRLDLYGQAEMTAARMADRVPCALRDLVLKAVKFTSRRRFGSALDGIVRELRPDAILAMPHLQPNVQAAVDVANRRGVWLGLYPMVHAHDPHFPRQAVGTACGKADVVFANTRHEARSLVEDYGLAPDRVRHLGPGIVPRPASDVAVDPEGGRDVLFVGRKTATKGLGLLAEAVRLLSFERLDFRVVLVGAAAWDTPDLVAAFRESLPEDQVVDRSDVSDDELYGWIRRCRTVVLPSEIESFGTVILEGWACARPVVTLDLPIFREIVSDGRDGVLVPPRDPRSLADAIARMLDSSGDAHAMGVAGHRKAVRDYSWEAVTDRLVAALPSVRSDVTDHADEEVLGDGAAA